MLQIAVGPTKFNKKHDTLPDKIVINVSIRTIVKFRLKKAGIDMSVDQAVDKLKNLTLVEFSYKGRMRWKLSRATKKQLLLMKATGADKILHSAHNR